MILLFFQQGEAVQGVSNLVQTVGFPVAIALMLLFFAYKVWINQTAQVKDKDEVIKEQLIHNREFSSQIAGTQERMADTFDSHLDILKDIKRAIETPNNININNKS